MKNRCPHCKAFKCYSEKHDAYFCKPCDIWLEKQCGDPKCRAGCGTRPAKPSDSDSK